jgi:hypothetical protein
MRNAFAKTPGFPWREIVGVAAEVYDDGRQVKPPEFVYWPALMAVAEKTFRHVLHDQSHGVFICHSVI